MARLSSVPGWVRPSLRSVAHIEDYLLRLFGRTRSPEVLGSHAALEWLGGVDGDATIGPLVWRGPPIEELAWSFLAVADALASGDPYPPPGWWEQQRGIARMGREQWVRHIGLEHRRRYAHGVTCALGWLLGEIDDPALMAPLHTGDGAAILWAEREEYRVRLRVFALPAGARAADVATRWPATR